MLELSGRPLTDTAVDRRLYAPRPEHALVLRSAQQRLNVLVTGPRGSGKTSLLRQVLLDLREADRPAVFVDGKLAPTPHAFLELVRFQLSDAPNLPQAIRERYARALTPRPALGEASRLLDLIESLKAPSEESQPTALLVDGLPSPEIGHTLFGRLRDELWQLPFNWIVAVGDRERAALMEPPADAFFDRLVNLGPMTTQEQISLLRKRGADPGAIESLVEASEGNPRMLLAVTRDATEGGEAIGDLLQARAQREVAAASLSRPASMLLAELENMGAASASDEELLRRLGWTRPRAAQVFAELEAAGLVTSRADKSHGGRPRKVYRPSDRFNRP